jgi:L-amino acid N-acyltransferase YncA
MIHGTGYAYANVWKDRSAYNATVEVTVYVAADARQGGIGSQLYTALLDQLAADGIHAAIGILTLPNDESVREGQTEFLTFLKKLLIHVYFSVREGQTEC